MLEYIKQEANITNTENGAVAYLSTGSECLDLFATVGGLRRENDAEIINRFTRAYAENPDAAMKLLFFARDIRGGLGERRVFRVILKRLAKEHPESVAKNLEYVAEYGRFDDLLELVYTPCEQQMLSVIKGQFKKDMDALKDGKEISLLAKWLPSINASNERTKRIGKKIARAFGLSEREYRKALSALRERIRIIENNLRKKDYTFNYEKQPSKAVFKYKKAFIRNDGERYKTFLEAVSSGKATLHADNLYPYELVEPYLNEYGKGGSFMRHISPAERDALNATWESLPDFCGDDNSLAVVDTSGSMYFQSNPFPASVALSLGLYFAQHNTGAFANHFIEFSERPQLIEIKGDTFADRLRYITSFCEVANTNLEAVFDLVLKAAVDNNVPQKELPARLIIISDMEFDYCIDDASTDNFNNAKKKYERCGYKLPQVVFWNVASRNRQQPVTQNEQGVMLVSGAAPRLFSMVAGGNVSPFAFMNEVLSSERYAKIAA